MDKHCKYDIKALIELRDSGHLPALFFLVKELLESYEGAIFDVPNDQKELFERERTFGAVLALRDLEPTLTTKINTIITEYGREQGNTTERDGD